MTKLRITNSVSLIPYGDGPRMWLYNNDIVRARRSGDYWMAEVVRLGRRFRAYISDGDCEVTGKIGVCGKTG